MNMKTIIFGLTVLTATISACGNGNNQSAQAEKKGADTAPTSRQTTATTPVQGASVGEALSAYLQIKNALAKDNGQEAASGGTAFVAAIEKMGKSEMNTGQKQTYDNAAADAKEMAEHIGKSADKIEHQREHFDMLSQDMYDLVKAFGSGQKLYKDFCPMYNNEKGASWLSETKEIQNPYLGKKMPTCGEVKEEIKH